MTRFRLTVEYDGGPSWAGSGRRTALRCSRRSRRRSRRSRGEAVTLHAAGRTDAGVHALAMTAHVDIDRPITPTGSPTGSTRSCARSRSRSSRRRRWPTALHARFSCIGRRYLYRIVNRRAPLALEAGRAWRVPVLLDAEEMNEAAQVLVGHHDFTTFRSAHCQSDSPVKTLDRLNVRRAGRDDRDRGGGALLPPPSGALDGRLPGAGRPGQMDEGGSEGGAGRARTAPRWASTRRPTGSYFVEALLSGRVATDAAAPPRPNRRCSALVEHQQLPEQPAMLGPARAMRVGELAIAAVSNQPSSAKPGRSRSPPPRAASGPRNQAEIGVTKPIFVRWRISSGS